MKFIAIEVKRGSRFRAEMISGLKHFKNDYPEAKLFLFYGGEKKLYADSVTILPIQEACLSLDRLL